MIQNNSEQTLLDGYMNTKQLAAELSVSGLTLIRWRAQKQGPPFLHVGKRIYYRRAAVVEWLRSQETG